MELFRALGALAEPPSASLAPIVEALGLGDLPTPGDHTDLFTFQLFPYASVYLGPEGMLGGEARDRVAGFWRALGVEVSDEVDLLPILLAAYASLCEQGSGTAPTPSQRARHVFLTEHLLSWLPVYLARVVELGSPFYQGWGRLLAEALQSEATVGHDEGALSIHLRDAPPLPDPRVDGGEDWLTRLLAPVRCGMVLARDDLRRCAADLGLGCRVGERRYVLGALMGQASAGVMGWLADEAERQAVLPLRALATGATGDFWRHRAIAAATLLREVAAESVLDEDVANRP